MGQDEVRVGARADQLQSLHDELADALRGELEPERAATLVTELAVLASEAATGVCRKEHAGGGYADLVPVLDDEGLRYCCTGEPQHCSSSLGS